MSPAIHKPCPVCGRQIKDVDYLPFCSKRCSDIDLGRWLKGSYAIPTDERPDMMGETVRDEEDEEGF